MKQVRIFFMKLMIFSLPLMFAFSPLLFSGESINSTNVARMQQSKDVLFGTEYSEATYRYYKSEMTRLMNPEVLILGDSRPLQIRSSFFKDDITVYNASYSVINTEDMKYFLESQKNSNIRIVIISLSHFSFNANFADIITPTHDEYVNPIRGNGLPIPTVAKFILKDMADNKLGIRQYISTLFEVNSIGMNAKLNKNGMLPDGSFFYGNTYATCDTQPDPLPRLEDALNRISEGNMRFQYGKHANPKAFQSLESFLSYCSDNEIYVIAFAPSYAPSINDAMYARGEDYQYQVEMLEKIPSIFDKYGFEFYDYTNATHLGCTDFYYLDGFHGGDVVYLRMFIDMIEQGSLLGEICDVQKLRLIDSNKFSDIRIFSTLQDYFTSISLNDNK